VADVTTAVVKITTKNAVLAKNDDDEKEEEEKDTTSLVVRYKIFFNGYIRNHGVFEIYI
jgi:hypothetical protein